MHHLTSPCPHCRVGCIMPHFPITAASAGGRAGGKQQGRSVGGGAGGAVCGAGGDAEAPARGPPGPGSAHHTGPCPAPQMLRPVRRCAWSSRRICGTLYMLRAVLQHLIPAHAVLQKTLNIPVATTSPQLPLTPSLIWHPGAAAVAGPGSQQGVRAAAGGGGGEGARGEGPAGGAAGGALQPGLQVRPHAHGQVPGPAGASQLVVARRTPDVNFHSTTL